MKRSCLDHNIHCGPVQSSHVTDTGEIQFGEAGFGDANDATNYYIANEFAFSLLRSVSSLTTCKRSQEGHRLSLSPRQLYLYFLIRRNRVGTATGKILSPCSDQQRERHLLPVVTSEQRFGGGPQIFAWA